MLRRTVLCAANADSPMGHERWAGMASVEERRPLAASCNVHSQSAHGKQHVPAVFVSSYRAEAQEAGMRLGGWHARRLCCIDMQHITAGGFGCFSTPRISLSTAPYPWCHPPPPQPGRLAYQYPLIASWA